VKLNKVLVILLLVVSVVGFLDATYLTAKYYLDDPVTCSLLSGCEEVTSSKYSVILGIPLALLGAFYYLIASILLFLFMEGEKSLLKPLSVITAGGFITTLYLLYLQAFVLEAFCLYCLISASTSTILFVGSLFLLKLEGKVVKSK